MGIGTGIALAVIGAILTFAVNVDTEGMVDLDLIGYILMIAGAVVFLISLVLLLRRRSTVTQRRVGTDPASGEQIATTRSTDSGDPMI